MSKFCGILYFDARQMSPQDEGRVRAAIYSPGCLTPQTCQQPGLFAGWAGSANPPGTPGLFQGRERRVCLWDGRIDNRKALLASTGLRPDCGDAELILGCYLKHGVDGLHGVIGDWSLSIWDAERREIVLASDYAGVRPLYYQRTADCLYWSSSLSDLVAWTQATELDDTYVACFLSAGKPLNRTPHAGIVPVPAGHAVSIDRNHVADRAFWTLPIQEETRFADEREYEERLLQLFRESVQTRMAASGPTCAELSGGLDSSSIVCMADRVRRETPGAPDLITFSYTHANSPDEKFYKAVERACQISALHLDLNEYPAFAADRVGAVPGLWEPRFQALARRMDALGASVLLTGQTGDFVMGNTSDDSSHVTELLAKGRFAAAAREAYDWGKAMQVPLYPILWRSVREVYFSWAPSSDPATSVGAMRVSTEDSLSDRLRAQSADTVRERQFSDVSRNAPPGRRRRFRTAAEILQSRTLQTPEPLLHVSYSHPFAHRPLLEFMLTIPSEVVVRPGEQRRLMRRAFASLLPPMVLNRKSKASYESTYRESLLPLAAALLKNTREIQLVERGYVDRQSLSGRLEKFTQGLDCNEVQLRQILLFEFWLRQRTAGHGTAESSAHSSELTMP